LGTDHDFPPFARINAALSSEGAAFYGLDRVKKGLRPLFRRFFALSREILGNSGQLEEMLNLVVGFPRLWHKLTDRPQNRRYILF
jgi:hypothetical protein